MSTLAQCSIMSQQIVSVHMLVCSQCMFIEYSLLHCSCYRQRRGSCFINTVQGHVWQVVIITVTFDLSWRQAIGVCLCCRRGKTTEEEVSYMTVICKSPKAAQTHSEAHNMPHDYKQKLPKHFRVFFQLLAPPCAWGRFIINRFYFSFHHI